MTKIRRPCVGGGTVFLAPMAGVNDPVFRGICKRLGADLTYSEMVSAKGLEHKSAKSISLLAITHEESPAAIQLFGKDPHCLAEQARYLEENCGNKLILIDINMGCPARKIAGKGEGAALMTDPLLAERIVTAVVEAVKLPVSVKIRKGYELAENTAVEFARMLEAAGAAQIAVHGRTARQYFTGTSDKTLIAQVKQAVAIPVIASGDVFCVNDVRSYLEDYEADAVMVARGAQGNPWIFAGETPSLQKRVALAREHTNRLTELLPHRLPSMRKHIAWYFKGAPGATEIRRSAHACNTVEHYNALFDQILASTGVDEIQ